MGEQDQSTGSARKPASRTDRTVKIVFLAVALAAAAVIYVMQRKGPELKGWQKDLTEALAQAEHRNTKIVVAFTEHPKSHEDSKLVTRCLMLSKSRTVLHHLKYVQVHLNNKDNKSDMQKYEVTRLPAVLLLDSAGEVLKRHEGFMTDINFCNDFLGVSYADAKAAIDSQGQK